MHRALSPEPSLSMRQVSLWQSIGSLVGTRGPSKQPVDIGLCRYVANLPLHDCNGDLGSLDKSGSQSSEPFHLLDSGQGSTYDL